jgi:hypothetical protein
VLTDVSEERIASIFRVEEKKKSASEPAWTSANLGRSSETSVNTTSTRGLIPEDGFLHSHRRENLRSYKFATVEFLTKHCSTVLLERLQDETNLICLNVERSCKGCVNHTMMILSLN